MCYIFVVLIVCDIFVFELDGMCCDGELYVFVDGWCSIDEFEGFVVWVVVFCGG